MSHIRAVPWGRGVAVVVIIIWSLFPVYWALNTSLMNNATAQAIPAHWWPTGLSGSNYRELLGIHASGNITNMWPQFGRSLLNTVVECGVSTVVTVILATIASYAFARMQFRLKTWLFYGVLFTLMLPAYATLIPLYRIMSHIGLVNTYTGIVLVYVSGFLPLAMWILYTTFSSIPHSLEEAAFVDGATPLGALVRIMLPIAKPGITAAAIIAFLTAWGQFLFPLVLSSDLRSEPLTVFITSLQGQHISNYSLINAAGVLTILIPILIVVFLNRYIISGILAGAVK